MFNCTPAHRARLKGNTAAMQVIEVCFMGQCVCMCVWLVGWLAGNNLCSSFHNHDAQEPERVMLLCRLRILNDAYNAGCAPSTLLQEGKALSAASGPTSAASKPKQPEPKPKPEQREEDGDFPPAKRRLLVGPTTSTEATAAATAAATRPVTFPCQHTARRRMHLARCVLRRVVGGGGEDGKGAGLQPDLFDELVAYVRPPWDPALAEPPAPR